MACRPPGASGARDRPYGGLVVRMQLRAAHHALDALEHGQRFAADRAELRETSCLREHVALERGERAVVRFERLAEALAGALEVADEAAEPAVQLLAVLEDLGRVLG